MVPGVKNRCQSYVYRGLMLWPISTFSSHHHQQLHQATVSFLSGRLHFTALTQVNFSQAIHLSHKATVNSTNRVRSTFSISLPLLRQDKPTSDFPLRVSFSYLIFHNHHTKKYHGSRWLQLRSCFHFTLRSSRPTQHFHYTLPTATQCSDL